MRRLCGVGVLAAALVLAGCGGDGDDEGASTVTAPAPTAAEAAPGCEPATTDVMTPIGNKLVPEGVRASGGRYVRSDDHDRLYFVSAELDGPGLDGPGDIATWATSSVGGAEAIYAVDELAREHSDWRSAEEVGVAEGDHGFEESRACVGS